MSTDLFDNRKIKMIEVMPEGDALIVIWMKLLILAGSTNDGGYVYFTKDIPYTDQMLSAVFDRPIATIQLALRTFEQFGMIEIVDNVILVSNWEKYQNVDGMEKVREQARKRMQDYRTRQRLGVTSVGENCVYCGKPANTVDHIIPKSKGGEDLVWNLVPCCKSCNSSKKDKDLADFLNDSFAYEHQGVDHDLVRSNEKLMNLVSWDESQQRYITITPRYDVDKNKKEDKEEEDKNKRINYQKIIDMYNATCVSFPKCRSLSEARKKAIRARSRTYSEDDMQRAFENMERSSFLKGGNSRNWCANFDWVMCDSNMAKVLDGNYQDHRGVNGVKLRPDDGKVHILDKIIEGQMRK